MQAGLGYKGDWVEIPMDDQRGMYWMLCGPNDKVGELASKETSFPPPPGSDCGAGGAAFCTFHPGRAKRADGSRWPNEKVRCVALQPIARAWERSVCGRRSRSR